MKELSSRVQRLKEKAIKMKESTDKFFEERTREKINKRKNSLLYKFFNIDTNYSGYDVL